MVLHYLLGRCQRLGLGAIALVASVCVLLLAGPF